MKKEFDLSKKIINSAEMLGNDRCPELDRIDAKDVKEFIKKSLEMMEDRTYHLTGLIPFKQVKGILMKNAGKI